MQKENEIVKVISFMMGHKRKIMIATLVGAIISVIVSLVIPEKFQSTVVFFPASSASISKDLLTDISQAKKDVLSFGGEKETEQFLQILQSDLIRSTIIQQYNLFEHYQIDLNGATPYYKMAEKFADNISFRKTQFDAIAVDVMDEDPQIAADIATSISNLLDSTLNELQQERALKALLIVESEYTKLKKQITQTEDSLLSLTKDEVMQKQFLMDKLVADREQLALLSAKYAEARVDAYNKLPHKYVVERAYVAEKKSYPIRWLIVVGSTIATFVMSIFILAFFDFIKDIKKKINPTQQIGFGK